MTHMNHLGFFYYLDEAADTSCGETRPFFEVACSDGFTLIGRACIPHCCMVELDELARGFTFINFVGKISVMGMDPNSGIMALSL